MPYQIKQALLNQIGFIRYKEDEVHLRYHFGKIGAEGWAEIVQGGADEDPNYEPAWAAFIAGYGLPEYAPDFRWHPLAMSDLRADYAAGTLPAWVLGQLDGDEMAYVTTREVNT